MYIKSDLELIRNENLGPTLTRVYEVLQSYLRVKEGYCFPSYDTIARAASISKRTAIRKVKELEKKGLLKVQRYFRKKQGGYGSNHYFVQSVENVTSRSDKLSPRINKEKKNIYIYSKRACARIQTQNSVDKSVKNDTFARKDIAFMPVDNFSKNNCENVRWDRQKKAFVPLDNFSGIISGTGGT